MKPKESDLTQDQLLMKNLITYNPSTNPMSTFQENRKITNLASSDSTESMYPANSAAPQVKIGEDGKIVINESSLVVSVNAAGSTSNVDYDSQPIVYEDESTPRGNKLLRKSKTPLEKWSSTDTAMFYDALSKFGANFMFIATALNKTRRQIRNKYKKEEKINSSRINHALNIFDAT